MSIQRIVPLLVVILLAACATPRVKRWEGNKITLCCAEHACSEEKWQEKIAKHCTGTAKQISGESSEKFTGVTAAPQPGYDMYGRPVQTQVFTKTTEVEECRTYQCSSNILGN